MDVSPTVRASRVFVILNPKAGSYTPGAIHEALGRHFPCGDGSCDVHEAGEHDDVTGLAREVARRGCEIVVAAGGDGTVSAVAEGLVGTEAALGILPLGTANVLARELNIPVDLEAAIALLAGRHDFARIDAMKVGDDYYFTQIGVGLDSLMIQGTTTEGKRRFGRIAYLWTAASRLAGFGPRRFTLAIDDAHSRPRALQVVLANSGAMGAPAYRWGPDIRPDDGRIDVCILKARTLIDYVGLGWHLAWGRQHLNPNVRYIAARRRIAVATHPPLPVQGDGEILGNTPVEVTVVPAAVRVVVPSAGE